MKKEDKEQIVRELTERLRSSETLLVADYRGLTMPQIDALRGRLLESGARFTVVKNTLTRRAAEAAGADALLTLLEGPSAIAFLEADGDMVAAAKALADMARESRLLAIRGGVLQGRTMSAEEVESIATLPPTDVLRGQVLAAIIGPVTGLLALVSAPSSHWICSNTLLTNACRAGTARKLTNTACRGSPPARSVWMKRAASSMTATSPLKDGPSRKATPTSTRSSRS